MPKKIIGRPIGTVHKVESKMTFGDFVIGSIIIFVIFSLFAA